MTHFNEVLTILLAYIAGLNAILQKHVWDPPQALWFMVILYTITYITDLLIQRKQKQLTFKYAYQRALKLIGNIIGGITLLYISSNVAKFSLAFFWMPQSVFALLLAGILIIVVKNLSLLEVISIEIYHFISSKIKTTKQKIENDTTDASPAVEATDPPAEEKTEG